MQDAEKCAEAINTAAPHEPRPQLGASMWALVPARSGDLAGLTHEMCHAFWKAFAEAQESGRGHYESTNAGYNAMLAASPTCPAER